MLLQKFKHHRVPSGPEDDPSSGIRLESLHTTDVDAQRLLAQSAPGANRAISSETALHNKAEDKTEKRWVPFFLRRTTLLLFAVSFVVLLAALVALWRISEKEHGLSRVDSDSFYYVWTYGPTAIFAIVSAFWGQVEYRALQLFPWRLMSRGFVSASDSVLLDYLSMWNVWALVKSLKRRHFMVSIAIAASLIIKLMTAISTGLFTPEQVHLEHNKVFQVPKVFDGSSYNQSAVDGRVYLKTRGIEVHNLSYPAGSTTGHVFQNFFYDTDSSGSPIYLQNSTYTTTVDVFTPSLECHEASVTTHVDSTHVELRTNDCHVVLKHQGMNEFSTIQTKLGSCDGVTSEIGIALVGSGLDSHLDVKSIDWRLWIYITHLREDNAGRPVPNVHSPKNNVSYVDVIGLMCKLSYSTNRSNITLAGTGDTGKPSAAVTAGYPVDIPGLAGINASSILYGCYLSVAHTASTMWSETVDYLLLGTDGFGLENLFDVRALTDRTTESVNALAVQLASEYLIKPSPGTVPGILENKETRITIRNVSAIAIATILGLLVLLSLFVGILCLPYAVCPRDPGSIGGLATILANSHKVMETLSGTGPAPIKELQKGLAGQAFTTTATEGTFLIKQRGPKTNMPAQPSQLSWWRPFSAALLARTLTIILPICLIVVLEILYQKSLSSDGLASVSANSDLSYAWTYIPALVMLGVRTLSESVYFSARVFQPYHELKRGHASPKRSIMDNQHRKIAIAGVWDALLKGQWAVMAAGVAVLIAPFLPIVVSGLYAASDVVSASNITLAQLNRANMSDGFFYVAAQDSDDVKLGGMILQYNLSYPQWTYQNLSLPKVEVNTSSLDNKTANALNKVGYFVEAKLPGLSLDMGCEEVPAEAYVAASVPREGNFYIEVNIPTLIEHCAFPSGNFTPRYHVPSGNAYFNGFQGILGEELSELSNSCPLLSVIYGRVGATPDKLEETTVLQCRPKIEQMDVATRLSLPSYTFDLASPPSVVPESTTTLFDGYIRSRDGNAQRAALYGTKMANVMLDIHPGDSTTKHLDATFRYLIYGEGGVSAEALLDPDVLKAGVQKVWSTVTAQMINSVGRQDYDDPHAPPIEERPTYSANLINPFGTRLLQNMVSTRILQAILATMVICGVVSILLMDTRKVLPKDPLSIAGTASLLADSSILDTNSSTSSGGRVRSEGMIPPRSEWCDDKQLKQDGVFQGRTFTLGWWDTKKSIERSHGRDDNDDEHQTDSEVNEAISSSGSSVRSDDADKTRKRFGIDADEKLVP